MTRQSVVRVKQQAMRVAPNLKESNKLSATLYRRVLKGLPEVIRLYSIPGANLTEMRRIVSQHFRQNQNVTDFKVAELLRHKAEQEVIEVFRVYKSAMHINAFFFPQEPAVIDRVRPGDSQFMNQFYKNR